FFFMSCAFFASLPQLFQRARRRLAGHAAIGVADGFRKDVTGGERNSEIRMTKPEIAHAFALSAAPSSTASRMIFLNFSIPSSKAAEMGNTGVLRILRLNFLRFSSATGSSILFATTMRVLFISA